MEIYIQVKDFKGFDLDESKEFYDPESKTYLDNPGERIRLKDLRDYLWWKYYGFVPGYYVRLAVHPKEKSQTESFIRSWYELISGEDITFVVASKDKAVTFKSKDFEFVANCNSLVAHNLLEFWSGLSIKSEDFQEGIFTTDGHNVHRHEFFEWWGYQGEIQKLHEELSKDNFESFKPANNTKEWQKSILRTFNYGDIIVCHKPGYFNRLVKTS